MNVNNPSAYVYVVVKPLLVHLSEYLEVFGAYGDLLIILKVISTVAVLTIFEYHKLQSTTKEFQKNFPVLCSKLDKKLFNKRKYVMAMLPFADIYLYFRIYQQRFSTVAFLKDFAIKKDLNG